MDAIQVSEYGDADSLAVVERDRPDPGEGEVQAGESFPLADAAAAHRHIEERSSTGKVVLEP